MNAYDEVLRTIALTMGVGWASGINLYAVILVLGWMGASGGIALPPGLEVLANPMVIGAAGFMYLVEFVADKVPGVDTGWDTLHTFVRIPAGAVLAAGAVGEVSPVVAVAAGILGGGLAAGAHATKAGARILINASPEPITNAAASVTEDAMVIAGVWAALHYPLLFLVALALFVAAVIWLLPKIASGIRRLAAGLGRMLGLSPPETPK